jgi:hypothetical protein
MTTMGRAARIALRSAALVALAATALAYFDPHLMRDLATRVWACF